MGRMENTTITLADVVDAHLAGYCEPDRNRRLELLGSAWTPDGTLVDPPFEGTGIGALADLTDAVLTHYPDHRFVRTTDVDAHHAFARYGWALVGPDGTAAVTGTDVVEFGEDGKLVRVVGFFGDVSAAT
jgi:GNAT superfamily N-acetyltransferase